jgi:hypothetical protein
VAHTGPGAGGDARVEQERAEAVLDDLRDRLAFINGVVRIRPVQPQNPPFQGRNGTN